MKYVLLLLLWTPLLSAQKVTLPAKLTAVPGEWVVLLPEKEGGDINWELPEGATEIEVEKLFGQKPLGKVLKFTEPGTYTVVAWNAKGDVASKLTRCSITVLDRNPPVVMQPQVQAQDTPAAPGTSYHVTLIEDPAKRPAGHTASAGWGLVAERLKAAGHAPYLLRMPQDERSLKESGFDSLLREDLAPKGIGLPVLVVQDKAGNVVKALACPKTPEEVLQVLK
jgi:hypothetical protein